MKKNCKTKKMQTDFCPRLAMGNDDYTRIRNVILFFGIDAVTFDRSGYKYHGLVKVLADSVREQGIKL